MHQKSYKVQSKMAWKKSLSLQWSKIDILTVGLCILGNSEIIHMSCSWQHVVSSIRA